MYLVNMYVHALCMYVYMYNICMYICNVEMQLQCSYVSYVSLNPGIYLCLCVYVFICFCIQYTQYTSVQCRPQASKCAIYAKACECTFPCWFLGLLCSLQCVVFVSDIVLFHLLRLLSVVTLTVILNLRFQRSVYVCFFVCFLVSLFNVKLLVSFFVSIFVLFCLVFLFVLLLCFASSCFACTVCVCMFDCLSVRLFVCLVTVCLICLCVHLCC